MRNKTVSVIIPTYNEERDISECLNSLKKQALKNLEIIVVDDGSKDKTIERIKKFKRIKIIKGQHKGPGFSRNLGARSAKGDILVFIDADMVFDKDYLKNLINPLIKNKKIIGATHDFEIANNVDNIWSKCWGKIRVSKENAKKDSKVFRAIRKDKFLSFGGFDPKYGYADDQTFWFKYKIKPTVAKNTTCYHKNPETLKEVYKQSRWIGASIENSFTETPIIKYFYPLILVILSPLAIVLLSLKRCYKNKNFRLLFPWMFIFMISRYFGTIKGIINKIYFNKNVR
ncbi:MAG: glycosyltransferase [Candidatus Nanoarchaeia archaeon]